MNLKVLIQITFILYLLSNTFLVAQNSALYGTVIDKDSGKPIKDVNIYLANTQIGATSNKYGYFEIRDLPQGTFTIVLSHISYYFVKKEIKLVRKFNDLGLVGFSQKAHELETVLVSDDEDDTWEDQFEFFRNNFIGEGKNSDSTFIKNPYKIDFYEKNGKLLASSTEPIEITNRSLGYKIKYFLDYFEATIDYTKFSGNAVFIPLSSKSKSDSINWVANRSETYRGSFRHFLEILNDGYSIFMGNSELNELSNSSLIDSISLSNSFPNTRYSSMKARYSYKIDSLTSKSDSLLNANDFIIYYVKEVPWEAPHPFGEIPISTRNLLSDGNIKTERYLKFADYLRVYYVPNYEENKYLFNSEVSYIPNIEGSYISLEKDSVMIDINGRYYDKFGIHTFGCFGQERISDMLPYEYVYNVKKDNE